MSYLAPGDVYVNGKEQLSDFQFKRVTKPLSKPPGTYSIAIRPAGASASSAPILSGSTTLSAGENATVAANLNAAGKPALNVFVIPASAVPPGDLRLVVRHVAQAPAVDVYAGTSKIISALTNPNQSALVVPVGTVEAKVTLAGQSTAVIGPVPLDLGAGTTTIVYAIGNPGNGTLTAVTQSYSVGTSAAAVPPSGVQAGTGGEAASHGVPVALVLVLAIGGLVLAGVSGARLYHRVEHALISLLALNGLRVSEATGANIEALGIERGHRTLVITRKGGKVVTIPLAPRTARAIDLAIGERAEGPIFLAPDGRRMDRHSAGRIVRRVARRAGITKTVRPHTLRHTFITAALDAGVPLRDVQEAASHADPRTTMRYDRARTSLDRHATYIVAAYVAGAAW